MPVKALEKAMTRAIVLKKGRRFMSKPWKSNDEGYCLEKRHAMPVKALEKAMTRAIALEKGRRCPSKPWKKK